MVLPCQVCHDLKQLFDSFILVEDAAQGEAIQVLGSSGNVLKENFSTLIV